MILQFRLIFSCIIRAHVYYGLKNVWIVNEEVRDLVQYVQDLSTRETVGNRQSVRYVFDNGIANDQGSWKAVAPGGRGGRARGRNPRAFCSQGRRLFGHSTTCVLHEHLLWYRCLCWIQWSWGFRCGRQQGMRGDTQRSPVECVQGNKPVVCTTPGGVVRCCLLPRAMVHKFVWCGVELTGALGLTPSRGQWSSSSWLIAVELGAVEFSNPAVVTIRLSMSCSSAGYSTSPQQSYPHTQSYPQTAFSGT